MAADCNVSAFELWELDPQQVIECGLDPTKYKSGSMSPAEIVSFISTNLAYFAYLLCLVGFAVGIINLVTSAGDKTKMSNGKNILKLSAIALVITILAQTILTIVLNTFGYSSTTASPAPTP